MCGEETFRPVSISLRVGLDVILTLDHGTARCGSYEGCEASGACSIPDKCHTMSVLAVIAAGSVPCSYDLDCSSLDMADCGTMSVSALW